MLDKGFFSFQTDNERSERLSIRWKMRPLLGGERKERKTLKKEICAKGSDEMKVVQEEENDHIFCANGEFKVCHS